ncbi:MAG: DivIVA domain-containing protein [Mycobacteriales bacterium]|nr:MAG: hypothetical protein DLM56_11895 [Pseudonocardiales bacterium]
MSDLTPTQHPGASFDVVMRGYDRSQVDEHVERLGSDLRIASADRDSAAARSADLASLLATANAQVTSLEQKLESTGLPSYERMGERIAGMLSMAEAEAEDIRRKAHGDMAATRAERDQLDAEIRTIREETARDCAAEVAAARAQAAAILDDAQAAAAKVGADAADERARSDAARAAADRAADDARRKADSDSLAAREAADAAASSAREAADATATAAREAADAAAAAARAEANEDFELTLNARRTEQHRAISERHQLSVAEAAERIATATAEAERMVREAQGQVDLLTEARTRVLGELRRLRDEIDDVAAEAGIAPHETSAG